MNEFVLILVMGRAVDVADGSGEVIVTDLFWGRMKRRLAAAGTSFEQNWPSGDGVKGALSGFSLPLLGVLGSLLDVRERRPDWALLDAELGSSTIGCCEFTLLPSVKMSVAEAVSRIRILALISRGDESTRLRHKEPVTSTPMRYTVWY